MKNTEFPSFGAAQQARHQLLDVAQRRRRAGREVFDQLGIYGSGTEQTLHLAHARLAIGRPEFENEAAGKSGRQPRFKSRELVRRYQGRKRHLAPGLEHQVVQEVQLLLTAFLSGQRAQHFTSRAAIWQRNKSRVVNPPQPH